MATKFDAAACEQGRSIARRIAQLREAGTTWVLSDYRSTLSADDQAALAQYRELQLATAIAEVEESEAGANIRHQEAQNAYRALVAQHFASQLKG